MMWNVRNKDKSFFLRFIDLWSKSITTNKIVDNCRSTWKQKTIISEDCRFCTHTVKQFGITGNHLDCTQSHAEATSCCVSLLVSQTKVGVYGFWNGKILISAIIDKFNVGWLKSVTFYRSCTREKGKKTFVYLIKDGFLKHCWYVEQHFKIGD